ncbi:MAG: hypothetical protein KKC75_07235 [Nanoarchaeota archaeon]|nr:hypothetical protein [Nanoarchaeota archaeon]MBU1005482.1 hypothetical protein [Nanoarchaeota archaeon]MBU1947052.1 hypothetical protein [Nanoarchaeota archaeon]
MPDTNIISEKPININELRKELEKIRARDKDLNFRAMRTEEYLQSFADLKDSEKLFKEIDELKVPRLRDQHIVKIIDVLPTTLDDIKTVLKAYPITVTNDNLKKIVEVVNKYVESK